MRPALAPQEPAPVAPVALCVFQVGAQEYVVDVARVEEVLQLPALTPLPRSHGLVEGVVNLRGTVVPVVDLRKHLGPGAPPLRSRPKLLVCMVGQRRVALVVDAVVEVLHVDKKQIQPAPAYGAGRQVPYVIGVFGPPERLRLLLNLRALWQPREEALGDG